MAAKPDYSKVRFLGTGKGRVHIVTTPGNDRKISKCGVVKTNHKLPVASGGWGRRKGLTAEQALAMDDCARCHTHDLAAEMVEAAKTPAQKRAERKQQTKDTMEKLGAGSRKPKKGTAKAPKKSAPRVGGVGETMQSKAKEHAAFAEQHGWTAKVWESGANEWTCEATKGKETLKLIYRDGRTAWSRVVLASGVEVRLRNSANWRKHAAGESKFKSNYQPKGRATSKRAVRRQEINDRDPRDLPFDLETDEDDQIIESLLGQRITWRGSMTKQLDSSVLPTRARNVRVTTHPKSGRKLLSFYELQGRNEDGDSLGMERTVYIDKILKVG